MSELALLGGTPTVTTSHPVWPHDRDAVASALRDVAMSDIWSAADGPRKTAFEDEFARFHGATHGIAVTTGTVSLEIALHALGIGRGDEVIVPAYTFLATATSVLAVNALPVFVDVNDTTCIDPAAVEAAITPRTRAVIAVHLGGHSADMTALGDIARRHELAVIEDAAQAHGAAWEGRSVGSWGQFGSFSFQASKNMTSGEGGILTTSDDALADQAWSLHNCGRVRGGAWYAHSILGSNYRMTEFQAAALRVQLAHLSDDVTRRERAAARLSDALVSIGGLLPQPRDPRATTHAWHLFQMTYDPDAFAGLDRGRFLEALGAEGVAGSAGYGMPLNRQPVFSDTVFDHEATGYDPERPQLRYRELELPVAERLCATSVWFPQSSLLGTDEFLDQIADAVAKVRENAARLARH